MLTAAKPLFSRVRAFCANDEIQMRLRRKRKALAPYFLRAFA
jgi:hypothetical protein